MKDAYEKTYPLGEKDHMNMIEAMIDGHDIKYILSLLHDVAYEKGVHILENYQDSYEAKKWFNIAKKIDKVAGYSF